MNAETKLKELNDELRAIKTAYAQVSSNFILYTYNIDDQVGPGPFISMTATLATDDGSNTIATVEGADYKRLPYEGGAKFYLSRRIGGEVKINSMQKGTVTVS